MRMVKDNLVMLAIRMDQKVDKQKRVKKFEVGDVVFWGLTTMEVGNMKWGNAEVQDKGTKFEVEDTMRDVEIFMELQQGLQ